MITFNTSLKRLMAKFFLLNFIILALPLVALLYYQINGKLTNDVITHYMSSTYLQIVIPGVFVNLFLGTIPFFITVYIHDDYVLVYKGLNYFTRKAKKIDTDRLVKIEYIKNSLEEQLVLHMPANAKFSTDSTLVYLKFLNDKQGLLSTISEKYDCEMKMNGKMVQSFVESIQEHTPVTV